MSYIPEIRESVIEAVAIDVVNLAHWPLARHVQPGGSVSHAPLTIYPQHHISGVVDPASDCSSMPVGYLDPSCEVTGFRIIGKKLFQPSLRDFHGRYRSDAATCAALEVESQEVRLSAKALSNIRTVKTARAGNEPRQSAKRRSR